MESIETSTGTNIFACSLFRPPVIGNLIFTDTPYTLNWSILAQKRHFSPVQNFCMLCNVEKELILYHPEFSSLNLKNELYGYCFHKDIFSLILDMFFIYVFFTLFHFLILFLFSNLNM